MIVEEDHDDARDVEGGKRRVDNKVGVVERAVGRDATLRVVEAEDDGQADGGRDGPNEADSQPDSFVVLVSRVLDGLRHGDVPSSASLLVSIKKSPQMDISLTSKYGDMRSLTKSIRSALIEISSCYWRPMIALSCRQGNNNT